MKSKLLYIPFTLFFFNCKKDMGRIPYKEKTSYVFSIKYFDSKNISKKIFFTFPFIYTLGKEEIYKNAWKLDSKDIEALLIDRFSMNVSNGIINEDQNPYTIMYGNSEKEIMGEFTGVKQNNEIVFIHPPREKFFSILEFNPFPIVRFPLLKNKKWKETLMIPEAWSHKGLLIKDNLKMEYEYTVLDEQKIKMNLGEINCHIIRAESKNSDISTSLTMYYNDEYGFVKLEYFNYDKSKIIFDLIKVSNN